MLTWCYLFALQDAIAAFLLEQDVALAARKQREYEQMALQEQEDWQYVLRLEAKGQSPRSSDGASTSQGASTSTSEQVITVSDLNYDA
jgi:hypothetical protein